MREVRGIRDRPAGRVGGVFRPLFGRPGRPADGDHRRPDRCPEPVVHTRSPQHI